jgi:hypothetical protein
VEINVQVVNGNVQITLPISDTDDANVTVTTAVAVTLAQRLLAVSRLADVGAVEVVSTKTSKRPAAPAPAPAPAPAKPV